ncbi:MAG: hypothetical protein RQ756_05820 [Flavobacteriaceae bacterium]|nr:hypothetical protein [Flavobacteriaceae bacterium]
MYTRSKAQESTGAIERIYITMRHLFNRGFYKPMGVSGASLRQALLDLSPEIYGSLAEEKVELNGLLYVIERLPVGIEECTYINLTSEEGYEGSHFKPIVPPKRRRNCYRIDAEQMNIEITRGRSDIYDILTHLTFLYLEAHKIFHRVAISAGQDFTRDWKELEKIVVKNNPLTQQEKEIAVSHTANILSRTFKEVMDIYPKFALPKRPDHFLHIIYNLAKKSIHEEVQGEKRTIIFSRMLRERVGQHLHGERWANNIKRTMFEQGILSKPIHIISANMHSVMNTLFGQEALKNEQQLKSETALYEQLSLPVSEALRAKVQQQADDCGMLILDDKSGTNIDVQIIDTAKVCGFESTFFTTDFLALPDSEKPVIIVMDYAFGEQAFETMDELLKPFTTPEGKAINLKVASVNVMGKAGTLCGNKGDIMLPDAHIFEGTADNYPFKNELYKADFSQLGLDVYKGTMVTVLGTSLQNKEVLEFFKDSTWNVMGIEMEGAHYQKAIQAASRIRRSIDKKVKVRYAYYASDNPLMTGSTLASGGLGLTGVKPTYAITKNILKQIFDSHYE